jgi:hypothetical protein
VCSRNITKYPGQGKRGIGDIILVQNAFKPVKRIVTRNGRGASSYFFDMFTDTGP